MTDTDSLTAQWLKRARSRINADPSFRRMGSVDVRFGIGVGRAGFVVTFAAFGCERIETANAARLRDVAFTIEMTPEEWRRFVADRRAGNGPTLAELDCSDGIIKARDPRQKLAFFRYHRSLQAFFDAGAADDAAGEQAA